MPASTVETETADGWALIKLAAASDLNVLGRDTLRRLGSELEGALAGDCRCLAIAGEGRSFAVGADLEEIGTLDPGEAREFSILGSGILRLIERSQTVVLAGIDGFCLGGGLDLALSVDWRLATERSVFAHPGADLGIITGFGGTQRLPRLIGRHRASRWLFAGERFTADEAYRVGLLQELCHHRSFPETLRTRMRHFASMSRERIRCVKQCLRLGEEGWLNQVRRGSWRTDAGS